MKTILLSLCFVSAAAFGQQTTYTYEGTVLSAPTQDGSKYVSGQITLPAPLPANGTTTVTNAISWSFDGQIMLSSTLIPTLGLFPTGDVGAQTASFAFTTVNGVITAWAVIVSASIIPAREAESLTLTTSGDTDSFLVTDGYCEFNGTCAPIVVSNKHHGSWLNGPAQVLADTTDYNKLMADYQSMMESRNTYENDYTAAESTIAALKAQIAVCRAKAGKC